jgi:hypothetical protein
MGVQCGLKEVLKDVYGSQEQNDSFLHLFTLFSQNKPTKI